MPRLLVSNFPFNRLLGEKCGGLNPGTSRLESIEEITSSPKFIHKLAEFHPVVHLHCRAATFSILYDGMQCHIN